MGMSEEWLLIVSVFHVWWKVLLWLLLSSWKIWSADVIESHIHVCNKPPTLSEKAEPFEDFLTTTPLLLLHASRQLSYKKNVLLPPLQTTLGQTAAASPHTTPPGPVVGIVLELFLVVRRPLC
jgi:hypothetical protein